MPRPRNTQISLQDTSYYHCVSRCVRKAYLCGVDCYTGQSYEHRREWIEARILRLACVFSINICAYSVMSNHLHLVLCVDESKARAWSVKKVLECWHQLFKASLLTQRFLKGEKLNSNELSLVIENAEIYRERLTDISWFMRALNEPIARQANREDKCTGRFWEGRFKSQALLDEAAVLTCMAYVDLNPIRAKIADTPLSSDFTSVQRRIQAAMKGEQPKELLPFVGNEKLVIPEGLMFTQEDYLKLLDETGRIIRTNERGEISLKCASILNRLNIPIENWVKMTVDFGYLFKGPVGTLDELTRYCQHLGRQRRQGASNCKKWLEHRRA